MDKLKYLEELKAKNNAIILAHYYQDPDIQDIADYMGDSLALAQFAQKTNADVILFCGVHFMSETAKILNPDKTVLIPDLDAGCSLADSASTKEFKEWVESHKNSTVVSYINCSAEVKAMSDIICTSSNAEKIINSIPKETKILFAPDKYLGQYLIKKTGRDLTLWNGYCQVHAIFSLKDLIKLKVRHPDAETLAHPECDETLLDQADFIGSTTALINRTQKSSRKEFIIVTEPGVIHQMEKMNPKKKYIPLANNEGCACNECPHMRLNTIDKMIYTLESKTPEIILGEEVMRKATPPLLRMLDLSK
ncbi:MAG: quinolinate synthase [Candidatus Marinimicrobia bacterium]|nr:quinolinate synthase [Candidatus Neomarinimicrobiota bacterium]|tara:strand:- start:1975 stop:2895 length:921 start_codon:yes stop_codon:yes gene_type:complete